MLVQLSVLLESLLWVPCSVRLGLQEHVDLVLRELFGTDFLEEVGGLNRSKTLQEDDFFFVLVGVVEGTLRSEQDAQR